MSIETALHTYLSAKSEITSIVGTRLWRGHLPQSFNWASPALTFWKVSEVHDHNIDGGGGCARARIQVDCWHKSSSTAVVDDLAEQVRLALQGFDGLMGDVPVTSVVLDNVVSLPEPPTGASDDWRQHIALDFLVIYRISAPQF